MNKNMCCSCSTGFGYFCSFLEAADKFDNLMSKGPIAMISLLAVMSFLVVVVAGVVLSLFSITPEGSEPMGFVESVWQSLMRTLDSGTMGGDNGWGFRIIAFFVTLGGIFIISTLIGVLGSGIEEKQVEIRKRKKKKRNIMKRLSRIGDCGVSLRESEFVKFFWLLKMGNQ